MSSENLPYDKSCIVIPTYNEKENVTNMINMIFDLYPKINLLFIDDGSPDGTAEQIEEIQKTNSNLHLHKTTRKTWLGNSVCRWLCQSD